MHSEIEEVNAMTLATASADGMPDARIVLLKGFDEKGFTFFTNYDSVKGPSIARKSTGLPGLFLEGTGTAGAHQRVWCTGLRGQESDDYFNSRPEGSRIGAWASPQSEVIESREWLEENENKHAGTICGRLRKS